MATKAQVAIVVKLIDQTSKQLNSISKSTKNLGKSMKSVGTSMTRNVTLPLVAMGTAAVKASVDMDKALRNVQAISGRTNKELEVLKQQMIDMSTNMETGAFSAQRFTEGMYQVESAGFAGAEALEILAQSSRAAEAGQGDLLEAIDTGTAVLKAYNMESKELTRVNDMLFAGVRIGKQTADQLASGIRTLGGTFAAFNIPVEDSIAALTLLRNKGVDAAEAATMVKRAVIEINKPTDELAKLIKLAGFETGRQMLATIGSTNAFFALNKVAKEHGVILADTFQQQRASQAIMTLTGDNMGELMDIQNQLANSTGEMGRAFEAQAQGTAVQMKKMQATVTAAFITLGDAILPVLLPILKDVANAIGDVANWFKSLDPGVKKAIVTFGLFVAAAGPVIFIVGSIVSVLGTIIGVVGSVVGAIGTITAAVSAAAAALPALGAAFVAMTGPIGIAAAAIAGLIAFGPQILDFISWIGTGITGAFTSAVNGIKGLFGYDTGKTLLDKFGLGMEQSATEGGQKLFGVFKKISLNAIKTGELTGKAIATGATIGAQIANQQMSQVANNAVSLGRSMAQQQPKASQVGRIQIGRRTSFGISAAESQRQMAAAESIRQQIQSSAGGGGGGFGGSFGGGGGFGGGMSLVDRLKSAMGSPDLQAADKSALLAAVGAGGGGGGGDIIITIKDNNFTGTPEDQAAEISKIIAKDLKKLGIP